MQYLHRLKAAIRYCKFKKLHKKSWTSGNRCFKSGYWKINKLYKEDIGLLKGYKVSIYLKENKHPIYFESQKMSIHILPMVVAKLKKMVEQGLL